MKKQFNNEFVQNLHLKTSCLKQRVRLDFEQQTIEDLREMHRSVVYFLGYVDLACEDLEKEIRDLEEQIENEQQNNSELLDLVDSKNSDIDELRSETERELEDLRTLLLEANKQIEDLEKGKT